MTPGEIGTLVGVALGSPVLLQATTWLVRSLTGREAKRRDDAQKAWLYYDRAEKRRRVVEEHAHRLRRLLIEAPCVDMQDIPEWPASGQTGPTDTKGTS